MALPATLLPSRVGKRKQQGSRDFPLRDQLVGERTTLTNQIRAVVPDRGHIVPQAPAKVTAEPG